MSNYTTLREANVARDIEWNTGSERVSALFRGVELAGEVGEVFEAIGDLDRVGDLDLEPLGTELADIVICADLVAMDYNIDLESIGHDITKNISPLFFVQHLGIVDLGASVGKALNTIKKLERERLGIRGSRDTIDNLAQLLAYVVIHTQIIADGYGIDLAQATRDKFNITSVKVGLATRYV